MSVILESAVASLRRARWRIAGVVAALLILSLVTETQAMAKMCLFSPVRGMLLLDGQPVTGALVKRTWFWHWKDQRGEDSTRADDQGAFSFPAVYGGSFLGGLLPHEPIIEQRIVVDHLGKQYELWVHFKHSYKEGSELGGKPVNLRCQLDGERIRRDGISGLCEWG
ncbi:DUF6795 domain-containing protein [Nevskia sp.]|uniref:DUF6795 domain-containing protein n=1 Tax=Nevskia sp. TaxID=1929292 RepID=UPI0025E4BB87|nr:DUF6795 domain-containing protein [Nevskia sp.]